MPVNIGNQTVTVKYFDPADSVVVNRIAKDVRKTGIYSGGYLTKVSDTQVTLSPLVCEIGDGTHQVRVTTSEDVTINVSSSTPYVVLRWNYTGSATQDYMDFKALAWGSIQANDLIVGMCIYSGGTLTGFDYSRRSTPLVFDLFLKVEPTVPASMRVRIRAGRVSYGSSNYDIEDQLSPLFTAPSSDKRIDLVYIDSDGVVKIKQGTVSSNPVPPSYDSKIVLAEVTLASGMTEITWNEIKDVRSFVTSQFGYILYSNLNCNSKQMISMVIENRTSDPASPVAGQIWMRVDL